MLLNCYSFEDVLFQVVVL